jgi:hypothetical protein
MITWRQQYLQLFSRHHPRGKWRNTHAIQCIPELFQGRETAHSRRRDFFQWCQLMGIPASPKQLENVDYNRYTPSPPGALNLQQLTLAWDLGSSLSMSRLRCKPANVVKVSRCDAATQHMFFQTDKLCSFEHTQRIPCVFV